MTVGTPTSRLPTQLLSFTFEADGQIRYVKAASRTKPVFLVIRRRRPTGAFLAGPHS